MANVTTASKSGGLLGVQGVNTPDSKILAQIDLANESGTLTDGGYVTVVSRPVGSILDLIDVEIVTTLTNITSISVGDTGSASAFLALTTATNPATLLTTNTVDKAAVQDDIRLYFGFTSASSAIAGKINVVARLVDTEFRPLAEPETYTN